jgi:hypothetical protein
VLKRTLTLLSAVPLLVSLAAWAPLELVEEGARYAAGSASGDPDYRAGQEALDAGRWAEAARLFARLAAKGGAEAAAALYWQAYAEHRDGRKAPALEALQKLKKDYAESAWLDDAKALEIEIRGGRSVGAQESGGPAGSEEDEELKLYALQSLMANDSERAVAVLEQFLRKPHSRKLTEQALFVLSQSDSPRARQVIAQVARGEQHPEMREKAIELLGVSGDEESSRLLSEMYASVTDARLRGKILESFLISDDKPRLLAAAKGEKDPRLRGKAIELLGAMGATGELRQLYRSESAPEVKRKIIEGLFIAGDVETLSEVARTDADPEMRRKAIEGLGVSGGAKAAESLKQIYRSTSDAGVKKKVIEAFFIQGNAQALIEVARAEKDRSLRREALEKLSLMDSEEAMEFLLKQLEE